MKQIDRLTKITVDRDLWICLCGNTASAQGFFPCDSEGERVEPSLQAWTSGWYVCDGCGRIIDEATRRVVGCRFNNTLSIEQRCKIWEELETYGYPRQRQHA